MKYLWLVPAALIWALYFTIMTPLVLFGFLLVPALAVAREYRYSGTRLVWSFGWVQKLYGNWEDGIDGSFNDFWSDKEPMSWAQVWQIIRWSAWRNSVGNARWLPFFGITVNPAKVIHYGAYPFAQKTGPYLCRQGWAFEAKFPWNPRQKDWTKLRYFWIGWRIAQQTTSNAAVGFAFQPWSKL